MIEENEEIRRLREDVAILKAATTFFVGELDPRNG
jgi:transposase